MGFLFGKTENCRIVPVPVAAPVAAGGQKRRNAPISGERLLPRRK